MIRPVLASDREAVLGISKASGLFTEDELHDVVAMLDAFLSGELDADHHWVIHDVDGPKSVAYYAPEAFTSGVWNLYMLAVDSRQRGQGCGAAMVEFVLDAARSCDARNLIVETSSLPEFDRTRSFYGKCGFTLEARVRDYYAAGDDKVIFWKALGDSVAPAID